MYDIHKKRKDLWRMSKLWRIFKRRIKNYLGFLNYGGYLIEKWRIIRDFCIMAGIQQKSDNTVEGFLNYGRYLKEKYRIMKDFWIMENIHKKNNELWYMFELWRISKRKAKNYERVLKYGGYLKEALRIMKEFWIMEDI